jgi:hypothetical protein
MPRGGQGLMTSESVAFHQGMAGKGDDTPAAWSPNLDAAVEAGRFQRRDAWLCPACSATMAYGPTWGPESRGHRENPFSRPRCVAIV